MEKYAKWKHITLAKKVTRLLSFAPDDWVFHPTTGLCTRLLGFALDCWALHPMTGRCTQRLGFAAGLCTQLLGFAPNYWALHPTTEHPPEYWSFARILGLLPEYWGFAQMPKPNFLLPLRWTLKSKWTRPYVHGTGSMSLSS